MSHQYFLKCLIEWFDTQKDCNVFFWCPDSSNPAQKCQIGAHKNILSMASDVFKTMFYGPMGVNSAKISGMTVHFDILTFKLLLSFIYGRKVRFGNIDIARNFYAAAYYFQCKDAIRYVDKYLWNHLNRYNSIVCCEIGTLYGNDDLQEAAWEVINRDEMILERQKFLTADPEFVVALYDSHRSLSIQTEKEFLVGLERYVAHNTAKDPQILAKIRPAIQNIAFLTLNYQDVYYTSLLTPHEKAGILANLNVNVNMMPPGFTKRIVPLEALQEDDDDDDSYDGSDDYY